jgi:hypothetical protein
MNDTARTAAERVVGLRELSLAVLARLRSA